jgi:hypothetical protein
MGATVWQHHEVVALIGRPARTVVEASSRTLTIRCQHRWRCGCEVTVCTAEAWRWTACAAHRELLRSARLFRTGSA